MLERKIGIDISTSHAMAILVQRGLVDALDVEFASPKT